MARPRLALATVCLILFLTFLDNTIVSVVLADVQSGLHAGVSALQWVVNGYALAFAGLMLSFGTLGDLLGRKKVMLAGVAVFCAGSVVAAAAPSVPVLVAGRIVMGLGAAASEPGTLSMIRHMFNDRATRARALGVWVAVSGLALALGPVIGGVLAGLWSWRGVFWFNLVFGLAAFGLASAVLPENSDRRGRRLDPLGSLIGAGALTSATVAIIAGETAGYGAWWIDALFGGALLSASVFVVVELRVPSPVLDMRYFRRGAFTGANFVAFATFFGVFSIFFFVALYLQVVGNQSGYRTALDFVPMAAAMVLSSLLAGRWVAAVGPKIPMAVGCLLGGAGILVTNALITPTAGLDVLGWTLPLAGAGFGIALVPVTSAALGVIPAERSGMAASTTNTSRELGAVAGVAILGSIVNGQLTVHLSARLAAIGIPRAFRQTVIAAVTTGQASQSQAASVAHGNKAVAAIVTKVIQAAYGAFSHGLDLALLIAAAFLLSGAAVALVLVHRPRAGAAMDGAALGEAAAA